VFNFFEKAIVIITRKFVVINYYDNLKLLNSEIDNRSNLFFILYNLQRKNVQLTFATSKTPKKYEEKENNKINVISCVPLRV